VSRAAHRLIIRGRVQGVGFRPFIYRHAIAHNLCGWVRNVSGKVEVHVQGEGKDIDGFMATLVENAPTASRPRIESDQTTVGDDHAGFQIRPSRASEDVEIHVPGDLFTCAACLEELHDAANRRFGYAFINCTECGPRYTIIESLPYDRDKTCMRDFPLCAECEEEYRDPANRRYHAEPVACARCGPQICYEQGSARIEDQRAALDAVIDALKSGLIVAVKGIGGYHLLCDAADEDVVKRLRRRKVRPHKPLAVMFPEDGPDGLQKVRCHAAPTDAQARLLVSVERPVVLVDSLTSSSLPEVIAPGLDRVGIMLPYSPLHHLLLKKYGAPLVATSANISGEPVLTDEHETRRRLADIADAFLHHDRFIVRPADDSVYRVAAQMPMPLRLGRGVTPLELELAHHLEQPVLALGAHMKNTLTLAWGRRAVVSPHIGEMDSRRSLEVFEQLVAHLPRLYQVEARHLLCDAHPGYSTTQWARRQGLAVSTVYHHHAHAACAWADAVKTMDDIGQLLVFTWDGVGLGPDGSLWGGEALLGEPGQWQRVASFRRFRLPGGDKAGREPWRSAAGLCWQAGMECPLPEATDPLLRSFWNNRRNAPATSAVGRIFDAAAALLGVCLDASFEGQGPMWLENLAEHCASDTVIELENRTHGELLISDWSKILPMLMNAELDQAQRARRFHLSMAHVLLEQSRWARRQSGCEVVTFSGGVFQNHLLLETAVDWLRRDGFRVHVPATLPVNDAGISFGQVVEFAARNGAFENAG